MLTSFLKFYDVTEVQPVVVVVVQTQLERRKEESGFFFFFFHHTLFYINQHIHLIHHV